MIALLSAGLLMMSGAPVPYAAAARPNVPAVHDYLALCDRDAKACSDFLFDFAWESSVGDKTVPYCMPQTGAPEVITAKVVAWLKARPELADAETKAALTRAMVANYHC